MFLLEGAQCIFGCLFPFPDRPFFLVHMYQHFFFTKQTNEVSGTEESLETLFLAFNDEVLEIRLLAVRLLGHVSRLPGTEGRLKQVVVQLLSEVEFTEDKVPPLKTHSTTNKSTCFSSAQVSGTLSHGLLSSAKPA